MKTPQNIKTSGSRIILEIEISQIMFSFIENEHIELQRNNLLKETLSLAYD